MSREITTTQQAIYRNAEGQSQRKTVFKQMNYRTQWMIFNCFFRQKVTQLKCMSKSALKSISGKGGQKSVCKQ